MNQDEPSRMTSAPQTPAALDPEGEKVRGRQTAIKWPWTAMLLAHVMQEPLDASSTSACRVLMFSPTADGLEDLEGAECVLTDLWLVFVEAEGQLALHGQRVEEISTWNSRTPGGRQLSILHCEGGRQIAIEDDSIFELQSVSLEWNRVHGYAKMSSSRRLPPESLGLNLKSTGPHGAKESGSTGDDETHEVDAVVIALIPEFQQVKVRDSEGHVYALTPKTRGVDLLALHEGQRILCVVTQKLPRVLSAQAVA